jgi:hypothetical protein
LREPARQVFLRKTPSREKVQSLLFMLRERQRNQRG